VLRVLAQELPVARLARAELEGLSVLDALVKVGLATSKGDARRGIQGKGFLVNGEVVPSPERTLLAADILHGEYVMLQKGKRNHALIVVAG
jgi:tyrosyl-tRNA synthetase